MRELIEHKLKVKQLSIDDHEQIQLFNKGKLEHKEHLEMINGRSQTFALSILDCTTTKEAEIFVSSYNNTNYVLAMMN